MNNILDLIQKNGELERENKRLREELKYSRRDSVYTVFVNDEYFCEKHLNVIQTEIIEKEKTFGGIAEIDHKKEHVYITYKD